METPCPGPLSQPWSPVGYRVVQLAEENSSGNPPPLLPPKQSPANAVPVPPLNYRPVVVADEHVPPAPKQENPSFLIGISESLLKRLSLNKTPEKSLSTAGVLTIAGVSFIILVFLVTLVAMSASGPARPEGFVHHPVPQPVAAVPAQAMGQVIIPKEMEAGHPPPQDPAEPQANPLKVKKQKPLAAEACAGNDPETFGTAVAFVRNPREAAQKAKAKGLLTFILHVSGNFEDSRFT